MTPAHLNSLAAEFEEPSLNPQGRCWLCGSLLGLPGVASQATGCARATLLKPFMPLLMCSRFLDHALCRREVFIRMMPSQQRFAEAAVAPVFTFNR
jgi:hypothetical protein